MTTEAKCPFCNKNAVYVHIESHASVGNWYACSHIRFSTYNDDNLIESVEFSNQI